MRKWIYDVSEDTTVDFNEIKAVRKRDVLIDGEWITLSENVIHEINELIDAEKEAEKPWE